MDPARISKLRLTLSTVDLLNAAAEALASLGHDLNADTIHVIAHNLLENIDLPLKEGGQQ